MDGKNLMLLVLLLACLPSSLSQSTRKNLLKVLHRWTFANFNYNSTQDRSNAEQLGHLTPGNVAILDADYFIGKFVCTHIFLLVLDLKILKKITSPYTSPPSSNNLA